MAHHKSTIKRIKTNERSRIYNKHYKSQAYSAVKSALETTTTEESEKKVNNAFKLLDRLVKRNIIHKNKVAHKKSQLSKHRNNIAK
jgi:small subunit ribosomal protein S20